MTDQPAFINELARTPRLAVVSDFDGTLAGFATDPYAVHADPRSLTALERLAALDAIDPDPSFEVFTHALAAELEQPAGRNGRYGEGVVVAPVREAVGFDLDAVFVLGVAEVRGGH